MPRRSELKRSERPPSAPPDDRNAIEDDDFIWAYKWPVHMVAQQMGFNRSQQQMPRRNSQHQRPQNDQQQQMQQDDQSRQNRNASKSGQRPKSAQRPQSGQRSKSGQRSQYGQRSTSNHQKNDGEGDRRGRGSTPKRTTSCESELDPDEQQTINQVDKPKSGKKSRIPYEEAICENCDRKGHRVLRCPGPLDQVTGQIHACGFCGSRKHLSEQCRDNYDPNDQYCRDKLEHMCLVIRNNLPALACSISPLEWPNAQPGMKFEGYRPWTGDHALEYEALNPNYPEEYVVHKKRADDTDLGRDPRWDAPKETVFIHRSLVIHPPKRQMDSSFILTRFNRKRKAANDTEMTDDDDLKRTRRETTAPEDGVPPQGSKESITTNKPLVALPKAPLASPPIVPTPTAPPATLPSINLSLTTTKECLNCGDKTHEIDACTKTCGRCGNVAHKIPDCIHTGIVLCVCKRFPHHLATHCNILCESLTCGILSHMAIRCSKQCCFCGASALPNPPGSTEVQLPTVHQGLYCPLKRHGCAICRTDNHVTSACYTIDESLSSCKAEYCGIWACEEHCQKCLFTGHTKEVCCNTVEEEIDEPSLVRCPVAAHPALYWGIAKSCPDCISEQKDAEAKRKTSKPYAKSTGRSGSDSGSLAPNRGGKGSRGR
ncbi:hypothetical protein BGAL_0450g00010 [Botrytis galanthina]|uniref:CCHC-type domain-containing protein n=1 Tax=Botrytis galanthina TaxID=278940 RepID=A0A4V4HTJ5_9HELO|nr:hypothetical protein BGAL_0450g00010 [Botrytis galanthina]